MSTTPDLQIERDSGNFFYDTKYEFDAGVGLSEETIDYISDVKGEDDWIRELDRKSVV